MLKLIFFGDIVGRAGRKVLKHFLSELKTENTPCVVIANVENAAGGFGITKKVYDEIINMGVDIVTGGNHIWDKNDVSAARMDFPRLALPANVPAAKHTPVINIDLYGVPLSVVNLSGKIFMPTEGVEDPFTAFDLIYEKYCKGRAVLVDFHAEATSEKIALAEYIGDRAFAVIGTHTHVQTADERILRCGTFFITDAGACCAVNSILGMSVAASLSRFLECPNIRMEVELEGLLAVNGVELILNDRHKVTHFNRINLVIP